MGRWGDGENCNRSNGQDACSTKLVAAVIKKTFDAICRFFRSTESYSASSPAKGGQA
ncbi:MULTISPECIES: hypothetical protein [unclassified Moorena]|uniref:hypothetical protein n=1 Tax=unclassified Moorena TaxID=2683338 RepID=UPI0013CCD8AD|nr:MULTISPECIES: hypothetical protein [unclassified Moorena]NEO19464.1 hypothetical protein [Moorena sp. SIO4A5]NEP26476.1 hypothetical protein [Moorena sp. SIO3I6]NEQ62123.1 hypothetical protein [Moorena sp. SIO4A1]